jgi:hypothetical protein
MAFKSCNHPIEIYISTFPLRILCILTRLTKLQYILIMKTSHNLNHAMHAHDSLFIHCEAYPLFHYEACPLFHYYEAYHLFRYEAYPLFHYYEAYILFHYYVFMFYALQFKLYIPILCKSCFLQIR